MGKTRRSEDMKTCKWKYDDIYSIYETSCNEAQYFTNGDIKENRYKYCPYCGKKIKEAK